ncbi:MAG: hypothetical protein C5B50_24015 [Verrucomicrobia bacterium]|nr:MAG: hypothetical protein C5B50_24015 [Verrucomicrobiota bacterium]
MIVWLLVSSQADAVTFTNLHSFQNVGSRPLAPLALGPDGNLYGTTSGMGSKQSCTVFKVTTNGLATLLHSFGDQASDGADAESALIQGVNASFYGTTRGGGYYEAGTVFNITTNGTLATLIEFTGGGDGGTPVGGLSLARDGNFYGATESGGAYGLGTIFRMTPDALLTTLYAFDRTNGATPLAPLVLGGDGSLYGTTTSGGLFNAGTFFQITTNGALSTLDSFVSKPAGVQNPNPEAPLVQGADGNFYGTGYSGGAHGLGCVFRITTNGALTHLYSFGTVTNSSGKPLDGARPRCGLVFGSDGNLYGTTESGGTNDLSLGGDGTIFKITTAGVLTSLYSFHNGLDGQAPDSGLLLIGGTLYGTASQGGVAPGPAGSGTVFKITTNGAFAVVYDFVADGINPSAELALDQAGNIYGTTETDAANGQGTVFKYLLPNASSNYSVVAYFGGGNGYGPEGQLLRLANGTFLGTAPNGGTHGDGTVFSLTTNGVLTSIYNFGSVTNGSTFALDGALPWSGLTQASDGNFYGTTENGGTQGSSILGDGVVFGVNTNGTLTTVVPFDGFSSGLPKGATLVQAPDGKLYGTTPLGNGSIFAFTPGGGVATMYTFPGGANGSDPQAGLAVGSDGCLYGTTASGGAYGFGTIFKFTTNGLFSSLYSFDGTSGAQPAARLLLVGDGFYGTTMAGGAFDNGVIFRFQTNGTYSNLHSFVGTPDGAIPECGLILGLDGNLYGVAEFGGAGGNGTLFELVIADPAPVLLSVQLTNNEVVLSWSAVAGRSYQLQFTGDLSQHVWGSLGLPVTATNSVAIATDPPPRATRRFYRVAMLP